MFRVATIALGVLLLPAAAVAQEAQPPAPPPPAEPAPPPPAEAAPAQERTITGAVKETGGDFVQGAVILVRGTDASAVTEADGKFSVRAPAGPVTLEVMGPAHAPKEVQVGADQAAITVEISPVVTEVVLTERAPVIAKQNLANGASVVRSEDLNRVSAQTIDSAIQGKLAGANVQQNSGAPGGGLQVRLRGVSTIIGQTEPLFIVDGVLVSNVAIPNGISAVTLSSSGSNSSSTQDDQVNRIADLNTNDIESIEVLKGASASALYGSKAANGVVIITTKRGTSGGVRANITQRFGTYHISNKLGLRVFNSVDDAVMAFGEKARDYYQQGRSFDHEEELSGRTPFANETTINLTGGNRDITYYVSLDQRNDPGIMIGTGYQKQSGRLAIDTNLGSRLRLGFTGNIIRSLAQRGVNNNDNAGVAAYMTLPFTPSFLDLQQRPDGTFPNNPFIGSTNNPLQTAALANNDESVWRAIASANASLVLWNANQNLLMALANFGVDTFEQQNRLFFPPDLHFEPTDGFAGTAIDTNGDNRNLNLSTGLLHRYTGTGFSTASSLGVQLEQRGLDVLYVVSRGARRPNVDSGTNVTLNQNRQLVRDRGLYLQEEALLLEQRLSLLAALRAEQSSTSGDPHKVLFFPKGQISFALPGLPRAVELLRLRLAYGESGNQPRYGQKFTALSVTGNLQGNSGQRLRETGFLGNPDIRPERQREIDAGIDVISFDGRGVLELSVYQKSISDLLLQRTVASSTGFQFEFINGGVLRNRGVEVMLQVSPIRQGSMEWLTRTMFSLNRSKIVDLPVPAFETGGFGTGLGLFKIEKGKSATQIVGAQGKDAMGKDIVIKMGDGEPDFRMTFFQALTWGPFGVSVLADWQKGSDVINLTKYLFDLGQNTPDFETAGKDRLMRQTSDASVYIEDAGYLKIREIELHVDLPAGWVNQLGPMKSARLSLAGRNLFTFTSYTGMDPEVSNFGNQPIARNIDVAPYPPSRSFWFSLTAGF